ncbi:MAG: spore photoproduct lyase family protein [Desulfobacterales bacterium]
MKLSQLFVDAPLAAEAEVKRLAETLGVTPRKVGSASEVFTAVTAAADPVAAGKRMLYLTANRGAFVRDCPGTAHYTCCGYRILHVGAYCSMDCAYCILQAYFHPPILTYFINKDNLTYQIESEFNNKKTQRFGTGEFTDSLIWEGLFPINTELVRLFAGQDRCVLELKSKTTAVEGLLSLPHRRRTILAWSLNSREMVSRYERGTAAVEARLAAAARAAGAGYPIAFHFDPIVIEDRSLPGYLETVERMFAAVDPANIVWISLGALRFMPALKAVIERRFPGTPLACGEFIVGLDGKMRYFKPLRIRAYREMAQAIRRRAPGVCLYLCMEDEEVWREALGFAPAERGGLAAMLDEAAVRVCGLEP